MDSLLGGFSFTVHQCKHRAVIAQWVLFVTDGFKDTYPRSKMKLVCIQIITSTAAMIYDEGSWAFIVPLFACLWL